MAAAALVAAPGAHGATEDQQAINFDPGVLFVDATAGEPVTTTVLVQNQTLVPIEVTAQVADMQAPDHPPTAGDAGVAFDYVEPGTAPRGAGGWVTLDADRFRIAAGAQREVQVTVDVPADAGAGGHFAALQFTASSLRDTGLLDADALVPVPLFVTVAGAYERDLQVSVEPDARVRWSGGRTRWTVSLHNAGDVQENVSGRVRIDGVFGGAASAPLRASILLPGERRTQHVEFDLRPAPDRWIGDVRITRDDAPAATAAAPALWVVPIWLVLVVVAAIGVVWWRLRTRRTLDEPHDHDEFDDDGDPDSFAG